MKKYIQKYILPVFAVFLIAILVRVLQLFEVNPFVNWGNWVQWLTTCISIVFGIVCFIVLFYLVKTKKIEDR